MPPNEFLYLIDFKYLPKKLTPRDKNDTIGDIIWKIIQFIIIFWKKILPQASNIY